METERPESVYRLLVRRASRTLTRMQYELDTTHALPWTLDEVSILFKSQAELTGFTSFAPALGLEHFNSVRDTMTREDDESQFDVRFEFFRVPGHNDYRIEAMCVVDGVAPLHEEMVNHDMPHVSFKCEDPMHYNHVLSVLQSAGWPRQAAYRNGYGQFTYVGAYPPYLKPRVNLRDRVSPII
jgi:hypothetical protein